MIPGHSAADLWLEIKNSIRSDLYLIFTIIFTNHSDYEYITFNQKGQEL